eukprot:1891877-Rhodomonas_salina.1
MVPRHPLSSLRPTRLLKSRSANAPSPKPTAPVPASLHPAGKSRPGLAPVLPPSAGLPPPHDAHPSEPLGPLPRRCRRSQLWRSESEATHTRTHCIPCVVRLASRKLPCFSLNALLGSSLNHDTCNPLFASPARRVCTALLRGCPDDDSEESV